MAPNAAAIIVARLAQGASAGLLTPQNSGLIQQLFRGAERGRAFGMFGFTVAVASAAGPLIGGLLIGLLGEENGWRSLFLVNVPIGLVALVLIRRLVPDNDVGADAERDPRVDVPGALLLGLRRARGALPADQPRGWRRPAAADPAGLPAAGVGVRPVGGAAPSPPAGRRCSTSRCCAGCRAMPTACWSAPSTSPGSPASSWCSRSTCRRARASRRWGGAADDAVRRRRGHDVTAGRAAGRADRPPGHAAGALGDDDRHRARGVAGDVAHRHPVVDARCRRCSWPASAAVA